MAVLTSTGITFSDGTSTNTNLIPSGTLMLFQQTAAPTGWTKQTTHNDKALRVVTGTTSSGGSTAFTSVFASRNTPGFTLTTTQIPGHTHSAGGYSPGGAGGGGSSAYTLIQNFPGSNNKTSSSTGGGASHSHSAMDFAVQYVDLIIASKN